MTSKKPDPYFLSEEFSKLVRGAVRREIVQKGKGYAYPCDWKWVSRKDMPAVESVVKRLQQEFPQIDHVRHTRATGLIVLDTKKDTPGRRISVALRRYFSEPPTYR